MKAIIFIALLFISAQASKLSSVTKVLQGVEKVTNLDLGAIIDCLDEQSSRVILNSAPLFLKFFYTHDRSLLLQLNKISKKNKLNQFGDCIANNSQTILEEVQTYFQEKHIQVNQTSLTELLVSQLLKVTTLVKNFEKDLENKKFTKAGKNLGKNFQKIIDTSMQYRDFNKKDTQTANMVNAFDNGIMSSPNVTLSSSVSKCYKTIEDFNNMHDFLDEVFDSVFTYSNTSSHSSFLSNKGKKLLKSLKKVNKCKSNTKAGKELTKTIGFDVFSDLADNLERMVKQQGKPFPENSIKTGYMYSAYLSIMINRESKYHAFAELFY